MSLTHQNIWSALDRLAAAFGYSTSGLAKQAGLDPTAFNKSKRVGPEGKPRWPSTESVARVLAATGATMSDFLSLIDESDSLSGRKRERAHTIPLLGFAQAGRDGYFDEDGYPQGDSWDEISFPNVREGDTEDSYALEISGDSMEPLYRKGDILVVSPAAGIRKGDRIVVRTSSGEVTAKELQRRSGGKLELKSLNPAHEVRTLPAKEISWMARIMWVSQ